MRLAILFSVALLAACNSGGCSGSLAPAPYVVPSGKPIPAQPANACDLESAHVQELGGCGVWSHTYAADCRALEKHNLEDHHQQTDHTCVISAKDCDAARACP